MVDLGRVSALWRYPVKSMVGEHVTAADINEFGLHADRVWRVYDVERGTKASAKKFADLLKCSARYQDPPAASVGPGNVPPVLIEFPDGTELSSSDPNVHLALSAFLDHDVRLEPHPAVESQHPAPIADLRSILGLDTDAPLPALSEFPTQQISDIGRGTNPIGNYVDAYPLHIVTEQTLTAMADLSDADFDVRRFRPNIVVDAPGSAAHSEWDWCGRVLRVADVEVHVTIPATRCVMPALEQPGLDFDARITRTVAAHSGRLLGVHGVVLRGGRIAECDVLTH